VVVAKGDGSLSTVWWDNNSRRERHHRESGAIHFDKRGSRSCRKR